MPKMRIKNWERFQHFKDRKPPWIKLYRDILDDPQWFYTNDTACKHLIMMWIVASENNGYLPSIEKLAFRFRCTTEEIEKSISELNHWLIETDISPDEWESPWPSRYIKDDVKDIVMKRDDGKCIFCNSKENLEYDHIIPVSKGGYSLADNLQLLCRSCNRKKRTRVANATRSVGTATPTDNNRNPETEEETEIKKERKKKNLEFVLPESFNPETWKAFETHRRKLRKPMTDRARILIIRECEKIGGDPNVILDQSIRNGWQGVFPVRDNGIGAGKKSLSCEFEGCKISKGITQTRSGRSYCKAHLPQ